MNTKKALFFILFVIILAISIIILTQKTDAKETKNQSPKDIHAFTKAICNETNFCQDNLIECQGNVIKSISPITGAFVQLDKEWKDPRTKDQIKEEC